MMKTLALPQHLNSLTVVAVVYVYDDHQVNSTQHSLSKEMHAGQRTYTRNFSMGVGSDLPHSYYVFCYKLSRLEGYRK